MTLECYSRPGTRFRVQGPFYSSYGHRGQDFYVSAGSAVRAYEDMTIEVVGHSEGLGTVVGARLAADGSHAGWAHLRNVQQFINGWVPAGTKFAEVAGPRDNPGTLWDGAHIHTTLAPPESSSSAAAYGNTPLLDPLPRILAASGGINLSERNWLMALSDAEQNEVLELLRNIAGFVYKGGPSTIPNLPSLGGYEASSLMGRVNNIEAALIRGGSSMPDSGNSLATSIADIKRKASGS